MKLLAICLALLSAVALAVGTQLQNGAVDLQKKAAITGRSHLTFKQLLSIAKNPRWVSGLAVSAFALALQFSALTLAPLILVQPIGAIALVVTSIINARITKNKLNRGSIIAVSMSTLGLGAFVLMAHQVSVEPNIDDSALIDILLMVAALIAIFAFIFFKGSSRFNPLTFIIGAGVLYGFVATLTKVVIKRSFSQGGFNRLITLNFEPFTDILTFLAILALVTAAFLGGWFVQNAYTSGPPDLVIAGLTVVDPLVAVSIGVVLLNEAMDAPLGIILGFIGSGAVAVTGVYLLSKYHPELLSKV